MSETDPNPSPPPHPLLGKRVTFIGAGNMAEAIVSGIVDAVPDASSAITVTDISDERLALFRERFGVSGTTDNAAAVESADLVLLAVKPQIMPAVLPDLASLDPAQSLVISIAAGLTCERLEAMLPPGTRIVRVMPNTPALVKRGIAGLAPGTHATAADLDLADALLQSVGAVVRVDEPGIDAVTAVSGSGPAYVFYLMEAMMRGARELGMDDATARRLVIDTVAGAAALIDETGLPPEELRARVTSKGGTTAAAIAAFDENGADGALLAGVLAAHARSIELAQG